MNVFIVYNELGKPEIAFKTIEEVGFYLVGEDADAKWDKIHFEPKGNTDASMTIFVVLDSDNIIIAVYDNEDEAADFDDATEIANGYYVMELL